MERWFAENEGVESLRISSEELLVKMNDRKNRLAAAREPPGAGANTSDGL